MSVKRYYYECEHCLGTGQALAYRCVQPWIDQEIYEDCYYCDGKGEIEVDFEDWEGEDD